MMYTPAATLKLAHTLAHEIGHHVVVTRGYIHEPWEEYRRWNGVRDPYGPTVLTDESSRTFVPRRPSKILGRGLCKIGAIGI